MLHILFVYTFLLLFLICKQFIFLCSQLVVKTKYIDTLMKLLLTLLTYPIKVRAGMLRPKVQILNTSLFILIKLLYFLLAICGYSRH